MSLTPNRKKVATLLLLAIVSFVTNVFAAESTKTAKTGGGSSPAQVAGRDAISNYNITNINNYFYIFTSEIAINPREVKNITAEQMPELMTALNQKVFRTSREEAAKWAEGFVNSVAIRKERLLSEELSKLKSSGEILIRIPMTFGLILQVFDAQAEQIKARIEGIKFIREPFIGPPDFFLRPETSEQGPCVLRRMIFSNGRQLDITVIFGTIKRGAIVHYPELRFIETENRNQELLLLIYRPMPTEVRLGPLSPIPDVTYSVDGSAGDGFEAQLQSAFEKLFELTLLLPQY